MSLYAPTAAFLWDTTLLDAMKKWTCSITVVIATEDQTSMKFGHKTNASDFGAEKSKEQYTRWNKMCLKQQLRMEAYKVWSFLVSERSVYLLEVWTCYCPECLNILYPSRSVCVSLEIFLLQVSCMSVCNASSADLVMNTHILFRDHSFYFVLISSDQGWSTEVYSLK